jgi:fatty acid desaturase
MNIGQQILFWFFADYALLFASVTLIYKQQLFILSDVLFAMSLMRCQYQHHDFAHNQFNKISLFRNKRLVKIWFLITTGFSTEYWNDVEHMPHHINVNNFTKDPDDFVSLITSKKKWGLLFILPITSINSFAYLIQCKLYFSAFVNLLFIIVFGLFGYYRFYNFILFSIFYVFTFALTQWFHHPKQYIHDECPIRRQVLNSRNIKGHHWLINYWMGGHDYQIEHHLFPKKSRFELYELEQSVKEKYSDIYQEITVTDALRELYNVMMKGK